MLAPSQFLRPPGGRAQKGSVVVEITIMLPFLLLLVFATIELGRAFFIQNTLTKRVFSGARMVSEWAIKGGSTVVTLDSAEETALKNMVVFGNPAGTGSALVDSLVVDDVSWTASGNFIDVTLSYSYRPMFASTLSLFGFGDDINLSANIGPSIQIRAIN